MTSLQLPNDLVNGTNADATPVEQNFNLIQSFCNNELINRDGSVAMTAPLLLVGDPTQANHAATKDYVDSVLPVGIMLPWPGKVAPAGNWMVCDGRSLAQSSYPELYGVLGQSFGGATGTFLLPNMTGRTIFGVDAARTEMNSVGDKGGTFTVPTPQHSHAMPHTHAIDHDHASFNTSDNLSNHLHAINPPSTVTSAAGSHAHNVTAANVPTALSNGLLARSSGGTQTNYGTDTEPAHTHTVDIAQFNSGANSGNHTHSANVPPYDGTSGAVSTPNTSNAGTAGAEMTPPFVAMLYIIRVK